jgi:hypothetical protein
MLTPAVDSITGTNGDTASAHAAIGASHPHERLARALPQRSTSCESALVREGFTASLRTCAVRGEPTLRAIARPVATGVASTAAEAVVEAIAKTAMPDTPSAPMSTTRFVDLFDPPTL